MRAGQDRTDFRRATRADDSNHITGFQLHWASLVAASVMPFPHSSQCYKAKREALI
jgi:hypothetical protein